MGLGIARKLLTVLSGSGVGAIDRDAYAKMIKALWGANVISYVPLWESAGPYAEDYSAANNDGTYAPSGVTYAQDGIGDGRTSIVLDGAAGYVDMYSAALATTFNGQEGSALIWFKITAAEWADTTVRYLFRFAVNNNNQVQILKSSVAGRLEYTYTAGGTQNQYRREGVNAIVWCLAGITWSLSTGTGEVRCYLNGAQVGATMTALGTWAGAIIEESSCLGAHNPSDNFWKQNLAHGILLNRAATPAEMAAAYILPLAVADSQPF